MFAAWNRNDLIVSLPCVRKSGRGLILVALHVRFFLIACYVNTSAPSQRSPPCPLETFTFSNVDQVQIFLSVIMGPLSALIAFSTGYFFGLLTLFVLWVRRLTARHVLVNEAVSTDPLHTIALTREHVPRPFVTMLHESVKPELGANARTQKPGRVCVAILRAKNLPDGRLPGTVVTLCSVAFSGGNVCLSMTISVAWLVLLSNLTRLSHSWSSRCCASRRLRYVGLFGCFWSFPPHIIRFLGCWFVEELYKSTLTLFSFSPPESLLHHILPGALFA